MKKLLALLMTAVAFVACSSEDEEPAFEPYWTVEQLEGKWESVDSPESLYIYFFDGDVSYMNATEGRVSSYFGTIDYYKQNNTKMQYIAYDHYGKRSSRYPDVIQFAWLNDAHTLIRLFDREFRKVATDEKPYWTYKDVCGKWVRDKDGLILEFGQERNFDLSRNITIRKPDGEAFLGGEYMHDFNQDRRAMRIHFLNGGLIEIGPHSGYQLYDFAFINEEKTKIHFLEEDFTKVE